MKLPKLNSTEHSAECWSSVYSQVIFRVVGGEGKGAQDQGYGGGARWWVGTVCLRLGLPLASQPSPAQVKRWGEPCSANELLLFS